MTSVTAAGRRRAGLVTGTFLVARRAVLTFLRTPQLVIVGTVQLVGFLVTFRYVFGGAFGTSRGLPYVDFAVPGFIAAGVPFTLIGTAVVMAEDLQRGFVDRLRSLPFPSAAVLTGRVLADSVVLTWSLAVATLVGFAIGFRLHGSIPQGLAAFGLCLVFGLAFSWVFITLGLVAGNGQAAQGMAMLVFPLTFGRARTCRSRPCRAGCARSPTTSRSRGWPTPYGRSPSATAPGTSSATAPRTTSRTP